MMYTIQVYQIGIGWIMWRTAQTRRVADKHWEDAWRKGFNARVLEQGKEL